MGLFDLFGKKVTKNNFGERLDRLTKDGELPYGWIYANRDFTEQAENDYRYISEQYFKEQHKGALKKYAALKSLVMYMEDIKAICIEKGECFCKWSEIVVANPDSLNKWKAELEYMEAHMDELLQQEKMLKKLRTDLKKIIQEEPGVKQENLYKRFSPDLKIHISNELYLMASNGIIRREKSGRSYELYIK